jgi:chaperonin cofactor prefoldin
MHTEENKAKLENSLKRISMKKSYIDKHMKRNDKLLEELDSLKNDDNLKEFREKFVEFKKLMEEFESLKDDNLKEFHKKFVEFKNDEKLLVEEINDFREELRKLGMIVPPKLVL